MHRHVLVFCILLLSAACSSAGPETATPTPAPTVTPAPTPVPVDWTPVERDFDGVTMVLVPEGCFTMGSDADSEEQPLTEICFEAPFWLDKVEVTQAQFAAFGGTAEFASNFVGDELPRANITWHEALAYCALRGGRLPTEAEWEYAARGPANLLYPWGNEFSAERVVYQENANNAGPVAVGSYPENGSWVGALDMSGNVWEWTASTHASYPYVADDGREDVSADIGRRVVRGGSWFNSADSLRAANRSSDLVQSHSETTGVRCARDA